MGALALLPIASISGLVFLILVGIGVFFWWKEEEDGDDEEEKEEKKEETKDDTLSPTDPDDQLGGYEVRDEMINTEKALFAKFTVHNNKTLDNPAKSGKYRISSGTEKPGICALLCDADVSCQGFTLTKIQTPQGDITYTGCELYRASETLDAPVRATAENPPSAITKDTYIKNEIDVPYHAYIKGNSTTIGIAGATVFDDVSVAQPLVETCRELCSLQPQCSGYALGLWYPNSTNCRLFQGGSGVFDYSGNGNPDIFIKN